MSPRAESPRRDPEAVELLRRSRELLYRPSDHGLRNFRAAFRVRITGHPRLAAPIEVAGSLLWRPAEGLFVRVSEGAEVARHAIHLLKSVAEYLRGGSSLMGDFPHDGLELRDGRTLEVHPGPESTLHDNAAALGWDRLEGCTIEFDDRGLPIRQVTRGHRSAVGRKAGTPDEMTVRTDWLAVGDRFVFREVEIAMTVVEEGETVAAEFPFRRLTSTWEFAETGGIRVPCGYRTRMERHDPEKDGLGVRVEEVLLESPEVNARIARKDLAGHAPVEELDRTEETAELLAVGTKAPDWELASTDGTRRKLADFRGKVVVLDFWATWCRPCLEAMPTLQRIHERFRDREVAVLGVSCWEHPMGTERKVDPAALMRDKGLDYTLLLEGDEVADRYRVSAIPTLYVIDGEGEIRHVHLGHDDRMEETLASIIERSLD